MLDADTFDALGYGEPWSAVEADPWAALRAIAKLGPKSAEHIAAERALYRVAGARHPSDVRSRSPRPKLSAEEVAERARQRQRDYRKRNRDKVNEQQRARRAAMTVEARRAEWLRAQHARRARLREMRAAA